MQSVRANLIKFFTQLPIFLQALLNSCLFLIGITLSFLLIKETWFIFSYVAFVTEDERDYYLFTEELLTFFLYFEFIALIIKYFDSHFHFPLRYLIYIGITAIVRLIIVEHDAPINAFWWALAILILIISLLLTNLRILKRDY
ncbi:phosphate-starvation-inducible protein PsiE [Niallia circulans]|jgi:protein PsiE|uniref:Protein PsiE n=3 Tax=Niallia circulans TaxID=1397 RepID=A0A0J1IR14_NIACI|nr:phosphate-starvation-inducible protein PsiE [Niallia circulans]AYV71074.1 phosphate-starvation-inducible protein PsiE [Niallia circulans]KLV28394.1 phosphate-starvation-inducible protein PsiE [Niallia circulans]MCM2979895.1 phosphate-starvation-inducible protein PsiE [Niallia circulans]MDR4315491.1 phosphate-starvation-inducible protein PsiE [Niallia circulans]MED3837263.1 phosphate-starvation-inducible protein PsiE [Niallia circulans]